MKHFVIIIFTMCWLDIVKSASDMTLDPTLLSKKVVEFMDYSVYKQEIQKYVWEKLRYKKKDLDNTAPAHLNNLAEIVGRRLQEGIITVRRLKDAILKGFGRNAPLINSCCDDLNLKYDERFKQEVATNAVCEDIAPSASPDPWRLPAEFKETAIANLKEMRALKWQYFGSNQGVKTAYPAFEICGDFDHRVRPWYTQGYIREAKFVVIIVDKSSSMRTLDKSVQLITKAKAASKFIIETLNPYDKFSALAFSNRPETWKSMFGKGTCYTHELAQATPQNKKKISEYIDSVIAIGGSHYVRALERAFQFLSQQYEIHLQHETVPFPTCIVHFLSDGYSDDSREKIMLSLINGNAKINQSLVLMTYGVGKGDFHLLKDMAKTTKLGRFTKLSDAKDILKHMDEIYETLSNKGDRNPDPVFTVPYFDLAGIGQIITALLPVYVNDSFVGVAAADLSINDVLAESNNYRPNRFSYSFVMDSRGMLFNHPLFPYVSSDLSVYMKATAAERDEDFISVFQSMKRGESGIKTFLATRFIPHGLSKWHGVRKRLVMSTYYWKKIGNTKVSVCLVIATKSTQSILEPQGSLSPGSLVFHRVDLIPPKNLCLHLSGAASDKSALFIPNRAFRYSDYNSFKDLSKQDVEYIIGFIEGTAPNMNRLKEGIKAEAVATHFVENIWPKRKDNSLLYKQLLWRFLGTPSGVFRIYPGTKVPKGFDPIFRPWYQHAVSMSEDIIITPPYIDAISGYPVITLSSVIHQLRENDSVPVEQEKIFAVVGADILLQYFNHIFLEMYPVCKERDRFKCIIVDEAGFVILIEEYLAYDSSARISYVEHLANVEPQITSVLIRRGVLQRINCSNIEVGSLQRAYKFKEGQSVFWGTFGKGFLDFLYFKLIPVPETNAYIIIRSLTDSPCVRAFFCHCLRKGDYRSQDIYEVNAKEYEESVKLVHNYLEKQAEQISEARNMAMNQNKMISVAHEKEMPSMNPAKTIAERMQNARFKNWGRGMNFQNHTTQSDKYVLKETLVKPIQLVMSHVDTSMLEQSSSENKFDGNFEGEMSSNETTLVLGIAEMSGINIPVINKLGKSVNATKTTVNNDQDIADIEYEKAELEGGAKLSNAIKESNYEYGNDRCVSLWDDASCECPCVTHNPFYNPCLNEYELFSKIVPPCAPDSGTENRLLIKDKRVNLETLPKCYDIAFSAFLAEEEVNIGLIIGLSVGGFVILMAFIHILCHAYLKRRFVFLWNTWIKKVDQAEELYDRDDNVSNDEFSALSSSSSLCLSYNTKNKK